MGLTLIYLEHRLALYLLPALGRLRSKLLRSLPECAYGEQQRRQCRVGEPAPALLSFPRAEFSSGNFPAE